MLREALLLLDDHRFRVADHVVKRLEVRGFIFACAHIYILCITYYIYIYVGVCVVCVCGYVCLYCTMLRCDTSSPTLS
jgi:hypothetical protein